MREAHLSLYLDPVLLDFLLENITQKKKFSSVATTLLSNQGLNQD